MHSRGGCFVDSITTPVWLCFFWTKAFNQCHRASPLHLLIQAQIDPTPEFLQLKLLLLFLSTDSVWETGKVYKVKRQNFNCTFVKKVWHQVVKSLTVKLNDNTMRSKIFFKHMLHLPCDFICLCSFLYKMIHIYQLTKIITWIFRQYLPTLKQLF